MRYKSTRSAGVQFCRSADQAVHAANTKAGFMLRTVAQVHEGKAGVYSAVLVEGTIRPGDEITLLA